MVPDRTRTAFPKPQTHFGIPASLGLAITRIHTAFGLPEATRIHPKSQH